VVSGLDGVAAVAADLARAAGSALDPTSVLERTMQVLAPVVPVQQADLWRADRRGPRLVASVPPRPEGGVGPLPDPPDDPGRRTFSVESRGQALGHLVVTAPEGHALGEDDVALLDIAAAQIAGALERLDLFTEVMELERLKSDFVARVSHELRTPITIISGFLETLIAHDAALDAERRLHMLDRSRVAAARLGSLIEELLILSRLEGGVLTPQPADVDVAATIDDVRTTASEPEQVLVGALEGGSVRTDAALLAQALGLIVDNALKYGGTAELSTRRVDDRWIVDVRDRGPGFADDIRGNAFEMFARSPSVAAVPGLGVGLALARTIVEVLDGTVEIGDADPAPGALVTVSLPA
jgi:signal transduction histidine kinase